MNATMELKRCILIYEDYTSAMCTINPVRMNGILPMVGSGVPLSRVALDDLVRKLSGAPVQRRLIPERVLFVDGTLMAWWAPAVVRPIYFKTRCQTFNTAVNGKPVAYPPLLFIAKPGKLSVCALKDNEKPAADTPLFIAPFYNIYGGGSMCSGNMRVPQTVSTADIDAWEQAFYSTEFTHGNTSAEKITLHPKGHAGMWYSLVARRLKEFPTRYLVPTKRSVLEAINL